VLINVIEDYLSSLAEREFDTPFYCLLLSSGFFDIHFTHGVFEFGKDFIAKRDEAGVIVQYAFQTKAGNINNSEWRNIRGQIEEMRINNLAHPNYSSYGSRKFILVTTGELVGIASTSAQQYDQHLRKIGESGFEIWDKRNIVDMFLTMDFIVSAPGDHTANFMSLMASIRSSQGSFRDIEIYSRFWVEVCSSNTYKDYCKVLLEASLLGHELNCSKQHTLASYLYLTSVRAILAAQAKQNHLDPQAHEALNMAGDMFEQNTLLIVESLSAPLLEPGGLCRNHYGGVFSSVTYPVLCSHLMEVLGLLGLLMLKRSNMVGAKGVVRVLKGIVENNPGCYHPISDKYAFSLIPPTLLLAKSGHNDICETLLKKVTIWLCDRYELSEFGLADCYSDEKTEIRTLIGSCFSFYELSHRRDSYLATVLLDLAAILNLSDLYESIVNDFLAVGISPRLICPEDKPDQFYLDGQAKILLSVNYMEEWHPKDSWKVCEQHYGSPFFAWRNGLEWESIAVCSVLRDRHRASELRLVIEEWPEI